MERIDNITYRTVRLLVLIGFVNDLEFRQVFFNQLTQQLTSKKSSTVVCGVWSVVCGGDGGV
jgi:hypothetical protein